MIRGSQVPQAPQEGVPLVSQVHQAQLVFQDRRVMVVLDTLAPMGLKGIQDQMETRGLEGIQGYMVVLGVQDHQAFLVIQETKEVKAL